MRLGGERESSNVEDRRGSGIGRGGLAVGGGLGTLAIALIAMLFGVDPSQFINPSPDGGPGQGAPTQQAPPQNDEASQFIRRVLGSTETTWGEIFSRNGSTYREPRLVLFSGLVQSACGRADASVGPFYCPGDQKVYIDLSFYEDLRSRFRAPGDFAQAYVIAHEVGHHVQNLAGTSDKVTAMQQRASERQANQLSVMLELQADCYAGVWGYYAQRRNILDPGDLEEALTAASAIGDDRLQRESQGRVVPDSFTHGSSEQRMRWFKQGFDTGDMRRCDTFNSRAQ
ncbi:MAG TPA: neutral zinc metallopeptidase [Pyrinomonadaceae bacterium]|jgi:predicted metalloprotease|nr:neutral zinc metallopeptidase [Pyrinomonadaceae bacterium]